MIVMKNQSKITETPQLKYTAKEFCVPPALPSLLVQRHHSQEERPLATEKYKKHQTNGTVTL
ncbi:MAG: hypothetical protein CMK89_18275 [Pseudomonadales bacterium]|nr:hypothetical protein [Pseudomonadales bacterium]